MRLEEQQRRLVSVLASKEGSLQIQGLPLDDLIDMLELVKDVEVEIEAEPSPVKEQKGKEGNLFEPNGTLTQQVSSVSKEKSWQRKE